MIILDLYDWIRSPEIREYVCKNHVPSFEEKVQLICGGCRSIEEKYEVLHAFSKKAETQDDKELVQSLLRLYDWALEELQANRSGQVFLFTEYRASNLDEVLDARTGDVEQIFHTYDELQNCIREYGTLYSDQFRMANIEKWVMEEGTMQAIMDLQICVDHGNAFIARFDISREQYKQMGICFDAEIANNGDYRTTMPLPFQSGDLVKINLPVLGSGIWDTGNSRCPWPIYVSVLH